MSTSFSARTPTVSISIVSHGQMALVRPLLADLGHIHSETALEVILTLNVTEALGCAQADFPFPLQVHYNAQPAGFGTNHNQAFTHAHGAFFCVLNPDIRIAQDPFPELVYTFADGTVGIAAPTITNSQGEQEDSARKFPSPWRIARRVLTRRRTRDYAAPSTALHPDWVGGRFMLLPAAHFRRLGGFDEKYFLYYEDVDLCARIRLAGLDIVQLPLPGVVHDAQRASHRDPKYLRWHVTSMLRFFCSGVFLRLQWQRLARRPLGRGTT